MSHLIETKQSILKLIKEAEEQFSGTGKALLDIEDYVAEYLAANGAIVPPCKVGDVVYELHNYYSVAKGHHTAIVMHKVTELLYSSKRGVRPFVVCCWGGYRFDNCDFDKTVFLSRENAEKALKGVE